MSKNYNMLVAYSEYYSINTRYPTSKKKVEFCTDSYCSICKVSKQCYATLGSQTPVISRADYQKLKLEYPERLL